MQKQRVIVSLLLVLCMIFHTWTPAFSFFSSFSSNSYSFFPSLTDDKIETITFTMDLTSLTISQQTNNQSIIQMQDFDTIAIPGKPLLWYQQESITIEENYQLRSLELVSIESENIALEKGSWQCSNEPYIMSIDHQNANFQGVDLVAFSKPSMENDHTFSFPPQEYRILDQNPTDDCIQIHLYPIIYRSAQRAEFIKEMTFQVYFSPKSSQQSVNNLASSNETSRGLIIAPDSFRVAALELKEHQYNNGVQSDVVFTSTISSRPEFPPLIQEPLQGYEDSHPAYLQLYDATLAYQIRDCIYDHYMNQENSIHYVTLLGDAVHIPPSYYIFCPDSETDYEKWIPTDLYYSHFASESVSIQPLIAIGRIPCNNESEALQMVHNMIENQEESLRLSSLPILLSGGDPFRKDPYFAELVQAHHVNQHRVPSYDIEKQFATTENCTATELRQQLQDNSFPLVWAFGHGDGSRLLLDQGDITSHDLSQWNTGHNHGLMISEGCGNASFDQQLVGHKKELSFGASLLFSKSGFTSYFGSTRDCWCGWDFRKENGSPTVRNVFYGEAMIQYFLEELPHSETFGLATMGAFQTYSMVDYIELNEPFLKTLFGFTFLGDPTTPNPFFQKVHSHLEVVIEKSNQVCKDFETIPAFSVHDDIIIDVTSPSPYIRLFLFHEDKNKLIVDQVVSPTLRREQSSHYYHMNIPLPGKGNFIVRFELENGQEKRLYIQGKKEHDLVLIPSFDLQLLSKGERKEYTFQIRNDGFSEEENVRISFTEKNQTIYSTVLETIPPYGEHHAFFSYVPTEEGEKQVELSVGSANQSVSHLQLLHITSQPITRIGILCPNNKNERDNIQQQLMIEDINKDLSRRLLNIELQAVPFALDDHGLTTFDRLHFDILMLFSQPQLYQNQSELMYRLVEFEQKGGLVCGMIPFGYSKSSPQLNMLLQNYFGIHDSEKLGIVQTIDNEDKLRIQDNRWLERFRSEYRLSTPYALVSLKSLWSDIQLLPGAILMGASRDNEYALIEYKNRILFTGYLNTDCFNSLDDSYTFFLDFFQFARNQWILKQNQPTPSYKKEHEEICSPQQPPASQSKWVDNVPTEEPVFPTAVQLHNDSIWIATIHGFYKATIQKPSEFTFYKYPQELIRKIGPKVFKEMVSSPSRNRFRVYQNSIVLYGGNSFYVFRPDRQSLGIQEIPCTLFDTFVMPIEQYSFVVDFEIHGQRLYVLDRNNLITVIDILSGRMLFRFPHSQEVGIDLHIYNERVYVLLKHDSILSYNLDGSLASSIPLTKSIHPYSFFISNQGVLYIYCENEKATFYEIAIHSLNGGTQSRLQESFVIRNDQVGDAEQFYIHQNTLIGIFSTYNKRDPLSFKGICLIYDIENKKHLFQTSLEKEYYTNINHTLFSSDCWIAHDGTVIVQQQKPLRDTIDMFSSDTFYWQGSIVLSDYAPNYALIDFTYSSYHGMIHALYRSFNDILLVKIDPLHPDRWQKMEISSRALESIQSIAVFQDLILLLHQDSLIEVYNTKEKRTWGAFYPTSKTKEKYALHSNRVLVDQKHIYIIDTKGNQLFAFTYTGDLIFCHSLQSSIPHTYSKAILLNTGEVALLNHNENMIQFIHQGKFTRSYTIENSFPLSFQTTKNSFLVVDYYGGIQSYSR
jgi:hypothetical protein